MSASTIAASPVALSTPANPLRVRDFRLLFVGEGISLAGDAFALVALPLLVLALSDDALALGAVMALAGAPRAVLMLLGGAVVDRLSPRRVMLASNLSRLVLTALLAATTLTGTISVPIVLVVTALYGVADAFYLPGQSAILPRILEPVQLPSGNALVASSAQVAMLLGPLLAGALIGAAAHNGSSAAGIGIAFAIDAATFLASVAALALMRPQTSAGASTGGSVLRDIREGVAFAWRHPAFRGVLLLTVAVQALIVGPFSVGLPLLVARRLGDPAAYGLVIAAFSGGALLGMVLAVARRPSPGRFGIVLLAVASILGFGLAGLAFAPSLREFLAIGVVMGAANGWVEIQLTTWLQPRIPAPLVGRIMSLVMVAIVGVVPLSTPVAGALMAVDTVGAIAGAGALMGGLVLAAATRPTFRRLGLVPLADPA